MLSFTYHGRRRLDEEDEATLYNDTAGAGMPQDRPFTVLGVHHVAMVSKTAAAGYDFFTKILGLERITTEHVPAQQTHVQMLSLPDATPPHLELLADDGSQGPVFKFLKARGGGIHHIALRVDDLRAALAYCQAHHVQLVDTKPRQGAAGTQVAFVHPYATGGILVELIEDSPGSTAH